VYFIFMLHFLSSSVMGIYFVSPFLDISVIGGFSFLFFHSNMLSLRLTSFDLSSC
jgi:hypothetical protein